MKYNPETKVIHPHPGEQCNLDDARADEGPEPTEVKLSEALALMRSDPDVRFCEHCTDEE